MDMRFRREQGKLVPGDDEVGEWWSKQQHPIIENFPFLDEFMNSIIDEAVMNEVIRYSKSVAGTPIDTQAINELNTFARKFGTLTTAALVEDAMGYFNIGIRIKNHTIYPFTQAE